MLRTIRSEVRGLRFLLVLFMMVVVTFLPVTAQALTTQDVEISATPTFISISNAPTWFDFSTVTASATNATVNTTEDHFTVTNESTVNINTTVQVTSTWEGGADDWTYGTPAEDTGQLVASDGDATYDMVLETGAAVELNVTSSAGENFDWELGLDAPTSFTYGNAQNCTVTLSASAA